MQYADLEDIHGRDRANLLYLVRAMDRAFLKHSMSDKKAKPEKPKGHRIGGK